MVKTSDNTKRNFFLFQYIVHATIVHLTKFEPVCCSQFTERAKKRKM